MPIPDGDLAGTNSVIAVTNITSAVSQVAVSLHLTHTFDQDLTIQLVSPEGITNTLSMHHGLNGRNYGRSCDDVQRTMFTDSATNSLNSANPPFVGAFTPDQALAVFEGKFGTNINGTWLLHVVDDARTDTGIIECWSLFLSTSSCDDGPGECPGADLGVGMTVAPEPVILGNSLQYTISVTNNGPSMAKHVVLTQLLPGSAIFVSATPSQGSASQAGGVVTCTLGQMFAGTRATITVVALPTATGLASSSATASSEQPDFKPSNNSAAVVSHISPPTADLSVSLTAEPLGAVLGATVAYSVAVTNNGPSSASGVAVTNVLPANVVVVSASISQGLISTASGNVVVCSFGTVTNSGRATASITTLAVVEGQAVATANVVANQFDPLGANNSASATINIGPAADMAIGLVDNPDPVLARSNLTYIISVTNLGPSLATGVTVNQTLPLGANLVDTNSSQGTITVTGNALAANLGTLLKGAVATITVRVVSTNIGTLTTTAGVVSALTDPNGANNNASATTLVAPPFITVAAAGATLTAESVSPANGTIDQGETVTVVLRLRNTGNVSTTNLVATLLATNGIVPIAPNDSQPYGVLPPSDFPVGKPFNLTASGPNGGALSAVLQLTDGATIYPPVAFNFTLPNTRSFTNSIPIAIPSFGMADPYPSTITVAGVTGSVSKVTATLQGFVHAYPHDVNVLLAAPSAAESILMSHAGLYSGQNIATLTFDDTADAAIPAEGQLSSGTFQPAAYSPTAVFPSPAPQGSHPVGMASFNSLDPNGSWSLYITDDVASDLGSVAQGWYLTVTTVTPINQMAELQLTAVAPPACVAGSNVTCTFTVTNAGPNPATFVAFTHNFPVGVSLVSATSSQGSVTSGADAVIANLGALNTGVTATVSVVLKVGADAVGSLVNSASVAATETDLNLLNNTVSAITSISLPAADIGVTQLGSTNTVVIGNQLTCTTVVTNRGPGIALDVAFTNALPPGVTFVSAIASQGSVNLVGGVIAGQLGSIPPQSAATVMVVLGTTASGTLTNTVSVATRSIDGNPADNAASVVAAVVSPAPNIAIASAVLMAESLTPRNGAVDPGETVSVSIALRNVGSANAANCTATLLASGGITPVGLAQKNYGSLPMSGAAVANTFAFTAGIAGSGVTATLQLQDGAVNIGTVTVVLNFPGRTSYSNTSAITIPDHGSAAPYPSTISVSGVTGLVSQVAVALNGVTHSFPRDLNVLLVSPSGGKALLLAHTGAAHGLTNVNLTFDDAASTLVPGTNQILSGTYKPTAYGAAPKFPSPAPSGPYVASLAGVNGSSPNGAWSLFVMDDSSGDAGSIAGGWSLSIATVETQNPITDLALSLASTPASLFVGAWFTNTLIVTNLGPGVATAVVVSNMLSQGVTLLSSSTAQGSIIAAPGGTVLWNIGSLPPGSGAKATLVLSPSLSGTLSSSARVSADQIDLNAVNNNALTLTAVSAPMAAVLSGLVTNAEFRLTITAEPHFNYVILASTNLTSWVRLATNSASAGGTIKYVDTAMPSFKTRFYRAERLP